GDLTASTAQHEPAKGPTFTVRITAIVRFPSDVNAVIPLAARQDVSYEGQQNLYLTPAFLPRLAAALGIPVQRIPFLNLVGVRLRHGAADWNAFASAASAIGHGTITPSAGDVNGATAAAASAQRGAHLGVIALVLLGTGAALVTLVLVGQATSRQTRAHAADYATMRALGATPAQVAGVVTLRAAMTAIAGVALAFVVAVVASPLTPIGLARQAETHPGTEVNVAVLLVASAALVVAVTASSLRPARRVARRSPVDERGGEQPSRLAGAVLRAPLPAPAAMGVRFGLGRGPGPAAPLAPALASSVLAVTAFVSAITFGRSLDHLVSTPRQQGWNWDVMVGNPNDQTDREAQAGALLSRNPLIGGYSAIAIIAGANQGTAVIDGQTVDAVLAIDPMKGEVYPPLLEGRPPQAGDEIVLGSQTLRRLHKHLGDTVDIPTPDGRHLTLRVVGRMISPSVGDLFTNGVGDGAWVYGPAVRADAAHAPPQANG